MSEPLQKTSGKLLRYVFFKKRNICSIFCLL